MLDYDGVVRPRTRESAFMHDVIGLFPHRSCACRARSMTRWCVGLVEHFSTRPTGRTTRPPISSHTAMLRPGDSPLLVEAAALITPLLADFGALLFGERLGWSLKEMWVNVLDTGGRQAMHNHANSFISGVAYLTPTHPDARTVFMKSPGGTEFCVQERPRRRDTGPYNADKWISPPPEPGDVVLFPSYLMHAVPPNPGERRITLVVQRDSEPSLDSWGYTIAFSG